MKKRILLFTSSIVILSASIMSYNAGPALQGLNLTGSVNGGQSGCMQSGCHSGGTYTNSQVAVTLYDSAGLAIQNTWVPNYNYKARLSFISTAPKVGFQLAPSYYNGTDTVAMGYVSMSNQSAGTHFFNVGGFQILEHGSAITVTGMVIRDFDWLSPPTTTVDTVMFFVAINNVNGTATQLSDNSTTHVFKIGRDTGVVSVAKLNADIRVNAYPNPVTDKLNISMENAEKGTYTISVFDMQGKVVAKQTAAVNNAYSTSINAASWASGMYHVQLQKGEAKKVIAVTKQ